MWVKYRNLGTYQMDFRGGGTCLIAWRLGRSRARTEDVPVRNEWNSWFPSRYSLGGELARGKEEP
jgi:hypothetical protein